MKKFALISLTIITLALGVVIIYNRINFSMDTLSKNGEYDFKKAETTEELADTTGPIIEVNYSNNDMWTNEDVKVTITASEEIDKVVNGMNMFDDEITFESEYFEEKDGIMAHGVVKPANASSNVSMPLIVWLHGGANRDS